MAPLDWGTGTLRHWGIGPAVAVAAALTVCAASVAAAQPAGLYRPSLPLPPRAETIYKAIEPRVDTNVAMDIVTRMAPLWRLAGNPDFDRSLDWINERLTAAGIATQIHYPTPPHRQDAYAELGWGEGTFPISEAIHREVLSLPIGPQMTDEQVDAVIGAVLMNA